MRNKTRGTAYTIDGRGEPGRGCVRIPRKVASNIRRAGVFLEMRRRQIVQIDADEADQGVREKLPPTHAS